MTDGGQLRFCLFGASAPANLGLAALRAGTLAGLLANEPQSSMAVFDDELGTRTDQIWVNDRWAPVTLRGARDSRRWHRPEAYINMRVSALLGGLGNKGLRLIDDADAILDLSGGDSFTDMYGAGTFRIVTWPKRLALLRRRPLVMLPQTYGPFHNPQLRAAAADLVRRTTMAWARDPDSFAALRELVGDDFDPARHREGVDVAFTMSPRPPEGPAHDQLQSWFEQPGTVVGVNVSGLMFDGAGDQFALQADGWAAVRRLCELLLAESDVRILLVPHVRSRFRHDEDDQATARLHAALAAQYPDRVAVTPPGLDAHQTKWAISRTDWFVGMRMHATIAALSSAVPTAAIAYSLKTRGVFATVGQDKHVADARQLGDDQLVAALWQSWQDRHEAKATLAASAPAVVQRAGRQLAEVVSVARSMRASGRLAGSDRPGRSG